MKVYRRILCVSDIHAPYNHIDVIQYLKALKKKYKPDLVILLGDELDYHAMSFHDSDPDLDSAGVELLKGINIMQGIFRVFPKAMVLESNHGSMAYRKAKHHGIPRHLLRTYMDVLDAPDGWSWHPELVIKTPRGKVMFKHQFSANSLLESQRRGMSIVQGHHHSQLDIRYWANDQNHYYYGATIGCMINDKSYAYAYNKIQAKRPILSHMLIEEGIPRPLPMFLNKSGRWDKKL